MRIILPLLTLFSCGTLAAQPLAVTENRQPPRCTTIACATAQEAAAGTLRHRYRTPIASWSAVVGGFAADFTVPFAWSNRQVMLHVEQAPADYEVRINGRRAAYNSDGNTPADFNITKFVQEGRNRVELLPATPSGVAVLESWKAGAQAGALGEVWLTSPATMGVRDVVVRSEYLTDERTAARAEIGVIVKTHALNPRTVRIEYELLDPAGTTVLAGHHELTLGMRGEDTVRFLAQIPDSLLWSAERPQRHTLRLRTKHEGRYAEHLQLPIGFRVVEHEGGRLRINGQTLEAPLREVSPSATAADLERLRAGGPVLLRPTPGAVAPHFYEMCDSLGLYVIAQAPIDTRAAGTSRRQVGNPSNDPAWREAYLERAGNCYHTAKRHPSVIAFSIADASANGICLYEAYLHLKAFGDSRPVIYPAAAGEWNSDPLDTGGRL